MSDALDTVLPRDEDTNRKTWCEPALTEYDVDAVTANQIFVVPDAGLNFS
jgi:hypothetical protein